MNLFCLDGIPEIHTDPAEVPGMYMVLGRVSDHTKELSPEEHDLVRDSNPSRQNSFATGRRLAKAALTHLGISLRPILRNERRPVWPEFVVGSISHTDHLAVSAVASAMQYRGIGVDIEVISAVDERVANRVLDEDEIGWINSLQLPEWRTALFSAKEAIYKATNPITGEFLGFRDVSLKVDEDALSFTAQTQKDFKASRLLEHARGYFHRIEGHWLTTFVIEG
ncbi:MAG: 4'-phosphopantetheinyl transferase superfamily protein [Gammaproteobacteria bacterium]|nr:4'-phosphopantetheinyl transferase superfamily protein [Gammaproteobacteria bacterium]